MDEGSAATESLSAEVFRRGLEVEIPLPFPRLHYPEAMLRYGNDKPDLRFGLEIADLCDLAEQTDFQVFRITLENGGKVRGLDATAAADKCSRKGLDDLAEAVKRCGAKGV